MKKFAIMLLFAFILTMTISVRPSSARADDFSNCISYAKEDIYSPDGNSWIWYIHCAEATYGMACTIQSNGWEVYCAYWYAD